MTPAAPGRPRTVLAALDGPAVLAEATGRHHRADPVVPRTGGPAGNAQLTAWTGLVLLVLLAIEAVTLLDVRGLIDWHIVVGVLLVPVALLKTATTGWRIVRYYTGNRPYRAAGPPPLALRLLGPAVVLTTLGVLGSGLALVALGADASRQPLVTVLGRRVDAVTVHQVLFILFTVAVGLHVLARIVPALALAAGRVHARRLPGVPARALVLVLTAAAATVTAVVVLAASGSWRSASAHERPPSRHDAVGIAPAGRP